MTFSLSGTNINTQMLSVTYNKSFSNIQIVSSSNSFLMKDQIKGTYEVSIRTIAGKYKTLQKVFNSSIHFENWSKSVERTSKVIGISKLTLNT